MQQHSARSISPGILADFCINTYDMFVPGTAVCIYVLLLCTWYVVSYHIRGTRSYTILVRQAACTRTARTGVLIISSALHVPSPNGLLHPIYILPGMLYLLVIFYLVSTLPISITDMKTYPLRNSKGKHKFENRGCTRRATYVHTK